MIKGCSIPQIIRFKGEVKLNRLNSDAIPFLGNGAGLNSKALPFVPGEQILAQYQVSKGNRLNSKALPFVPSEQILAQCQVPKGNGLNSKALPFVPSEQTLAQCQVSKGNGLNLCAESSVAKGKENSPARTEYSEKEEDIVNPRIETVIIFSKYDADGTESPKTIIIYPEDSEIKEHIVYHNTRNTVTKYKNGIREEFYKNNADGTEGSKCIIRHPEGSEIKEHIIFYNTGDTVTKYRDGIRKEFYNLDTKGKEAPHTRTIYPEGSEMKERTIFHNTGDTITRYSKGISIKENKLEGIKVVSIRNQRNNLLDYLWEKIDVPDEQILARLQAYKGNVLNLGAESSVAKDKGNSPTRTEDSEKGEKSVNPYTEGVITFYKDDRIEISYKNDADGQKNPHTITKYPKDSNIKKRVVYHNNDTIVTFYKDGRREVFYIYNTKGQKNPQTRIVYPKGSDIKEYITFHKTGDTITKFENDIKKMFYKYNSKGEKHSQTVTIYPESSDIKEHILFHNNGDTITKYSNGISIKENKLEGSKTASIKDQQNNEIDYLWEKIDAENRNIVFKDETGSYLSVNENISKTFNELAVKFAERLKSQPG